MFLRTSGTPSQEILGKIGFRQPSSRAGFELFKQRRADHLRRIQAIANEPMLPPRGGEKFRDAERKAKMAAMWKWRRELPAKDAIRGKTRAARDAFHECGHAFLAAYHGLPLYEIYLNKPGTGACILFGVTDWAHPSWRHFDAGLAGALSQSRFMGGPRSYPSPSDERHSIAPNENRDGPQSNRATAEKRVWKILLANWEHVEFLALKLLVLGSLDGCQVRTWLRDRGLSIPAPS